MVLINEKAFKIYTIDTTETIMERLAYEMKTLTKYLYFPEGIPSIDDFKSSKNIKVDDVRNIITDSKFGIDFEKLYKTVRPLLSDSVSDKSILETYMSESKILTDVDENFAQAYLLTLDQAVKNLGIKDVDIYSTFEGVNEYKSSFQKSFNTLEKRVKEQTKLAKSLDSMIGIEFTKFELEKVNFEIKLNLKDISIMEIFNQIQLDVGVPFACVNGFFKILKDFTPEEDWGNYLENAIIMKVLQKEEAMNIKPSDYTDIILASIDQDNNEKLTAGMTLSTSNQYMERDQIISRFTQTIKDVGDIKVDEIEESYVNGVFYFPKHTMDKYIMSDMIMNDPLFSGLLSIDESDKASKSKASIYVHFKHPFVGEVTANITEKISDREDQSLRGKDMKELFKPGSKYIRVKVSSANNIDSVKFFQDVLSKLFKIYDANFESIQNFYKRFIPDFGKKVSIPSKEIRKMKLKDIAPEVFVNRYPTKCPSQPTIIEDDEVEEAISQGKEVMKYPQTIDEGFEPRNYICNHEDAKYPGLRSNPLSNKDVVPYLPCCYEKRHSDKKGSIYRHYFYGEDLALKDKDQQDFITTNKFVDRNNFGILPADISKVFKLLSDEEGYTYVRKGVLNTESSFINCVLEGLHEETGILDYEDTSEIEAYLYQIREELANADTAAAAKQEMYDYTIEEIMSIISNIDTYLEPRLFVGMLEKIYNCNIFVFNRNKRNGQLMLPRHLQAYYKTKNTGKCIFIYEHTGTTNKPRCELIVKWKVGSSESSDLSYYENNDSEVAIGVNRLFRQMIQSYSLNQLIPEINFPATFKMIKQTIDTYGKTRMIEFEFKGKTGTLLTTPMDPLVLTPSEQTSIIPTKIDIDDAIEFAEKYNIQLSDQIVSNSIVKELTGKLGNVSISIPVTDTVPIPGMSTLDYGLRYPENTTSELKRYNTYKKLARYIVEYMFWLYSKFIATSQGASIEDFIDKNVTIIPSFEYGQVNKIFSMDSGVMNNSKLVIKSEETLKRLVYVLRLKITREQNVLTKYKDRKVIDNFYTDVTDFDQYQNQVVLEGDESVDKWIKEQKTNYYLNDEVKIGRRVPYFFKNDLVGDQIYLAQNTNSQYDAIKIAETWYSEGYNPGEDIDETGDPVEFTLFSYVNKNNIKQYKVKGPETPYDIRMIGYKVEDMSFFTVLLPF